MPPVFSILVPTVNRPETLLHCLKTIVAQPGNDYEIVVSDDQGPPENREVVESVGRLDVLRYLRTPQRLGMRGNYEYCVENSRGEYVTILGDDDGFCVNALRTARNVLADGRPEVLFWFPHLYWWPNALLEHKQWMLYVYANPNAAQRVQPRELLTEFFSNGANPWLFERLPSIYNGFVSRGLLTRLKERTGAYFCDEVPDVYSGIANALMARSGVFLERPLTIRGLSGKSYGVAFRNKKQGAELRADFQRHMTTPLCAPELVDSTALAVHIASVKMRAIQRFTELSDRKVRIQDVIAGIFTEMNEDPDRYDELLGDARALAAKYRVEIPAANIPPRVVQRKAKQCGVSPLPGGRSVIALNGEPLKIADIYLASLCVHSILG